MLAVTWDVWLDTLGPEGLKTGYWILAAFVFGLCLGTSYTVVGPVKDEDDDSGPRTGRPKPPSGREQAPPAPTQKF